MGLGAAFAKGVQIAKEEQERKRALAVQEDERGRRNAIQDEDRSVSRQVQGRNLALQELELLKGQRAPTEQLPEGVMGPPQTLREALTIPGVSGGGINLPARSVQPEYMEDVLTQKRAEQDVADQRTGARFKEEQTLRDALEAINVSPEQAAALGGLIQPGMRKPAELQAAATTYNAKESRRLSEQLARERASGKAEATGEKERIRQQEVSSYVQALQDGSATKEDIPVSIRGAVTTAAQAAGVRPLDRKEHEQIKAFQGFENQAAQIRDSFDSGAVGPLEGRIPDFLTGTETASFRASVAGMFNELGKLRSGGAITPQEYDRLRKELPDVADTETVFKAKLDRFMSSLALKRASLMEPVNRGGPKPSPSAPSGGGGGGNGAASDPGGLF